MKDFRAVIALFIFASCILSTIIISNNTVNADDPIETAYDYFSRPIGSFGTNMTVFRNPNWTYWQSWLRDNFYWSLKGSPDGVTWYNDTIGLMDVDIAWDKLNTSAKVTLILDTHDAPMPLYYMFELGCKAYLKSYINKSTNYEYIFTLPANLTEDYNLTFNFSDVMPLVQNGKVTVKHGVKNIDGTDYIGFRVTTVNKIDVGKIFIVDPTFGDTGTSGSAAVIGNQLRYYPININQALDVYLDKIVAYVYTDYHDPHIKGAVYNYISDTNVGTLIEASEIVLATYRWAWHSYTLNFAGTTVLSAGEDYVLAMWADTGVAVYVYWGAGQGGYVNLGYTTWPSPIVNEIDQNRQYTFYIDCTDIPANTAPTVDYKTPVNGSVGIPCSGGVACYAYTNDTDGDNLNVTFASNYSNGVDWVNYHTNVSEAANGTESYTFTGFTDSGTTYWWRVYVDDGTDNVSETYHFETTSIWIDITNASWSIGNVVMSSSSWTNETGVTFIANKDNCTVTTDLKLQITVDGADWSSATSGNEPDANTYRINASTDSWVTEFQIIFATTTTISTNIATDQNESFDLRFDAPTSTTYPDQQSITITATLVQH